MRLRTMTGLFLLALLSSAWPASPHGGHEHGKKEAEIRHHDLRGTLRAVDPGAKTFELQVKGKPVMCFFDEKTRITRDGKDIPFSELKPGDALTCRCSEEKEGRHYSQRIWLRSR